MSNDNNHEDALTNALDNLTGLTEDERKAVYDRWMADEAKKPPADERPKFDVPDWLREAAEALERAVDDGTLNVPTDARIADDEDEMVDMALKTMEMASEATVLLIEARRELLDATLNLNDAKARYEDAKRDAYLMGSVTGKNAEERDARLASLLEVQIHNVRRAEAEWLKAKVEVECCEDTLKGMDRVDRHSAMIQSILRGE